MFPQAAEATSEPLKERTRCHYGRIKKGPDWSSMLMAATTEILLVYQAWDCVTRRLNLIEFAEIHTYQLRSEGLDCWQCSSTEEGKDLWR